MAYPEIKSLPAVGVWFEVKSKVSQSTVGHGIDDWRSYPHMNNKSNWKEMMGTRAAEFSSFLEAQSIWVTECLICKEAGRVMRTDFGGHVGAPFHFKDIGRLRLCDGVSLTALRGSMWQSYNVVGGAIRFNHADGAIEMCSGEPRDEERLRLTPPPLVDAAPGDIQRLEELAEENCWVKVVEAIGPPTATNGDWTKVPWLASKTSWKLGMAEPARKVCRFLEGFGVYPECSICARSLGFEDHIPAEKHLKVLSERLPDGVSVTALAQHLWQTWCVPGGAIRFNHVSGVIDLCRGTPPDSSGALGPPPPLPPAPVAAPIAVPSGSFWRQVAR